MGWFVGFAKDFCIEAVWTQKYLTCTPLASPKWAKKQYWIGKNHDPGSQGDKLPKKIVPWNCWWNKPLTKKQWFFLVLGQKTTLLFSKGLFHSENRSLKGLQGWRLACLTWKYCCRPWPVPLGRKFSHVSIYMPWKSFCRLPFEWYFCKDFGFSKGLDSSTISRDYTFNGRLDFQGYVWFM